jgi:acetyltransferase-like isoleucine patch superfamily enzyme
MDAREAFHRFFGIFLVPLSMFGPFSFIRVWANRMRGVKIGKKVWIGYSAFIDQPPEKAEPMIEIQDNVGIGFGNVIFSHDSSPEHSGGPVIYKKVVIGKNVFLGAHVTILPGVKIGEGAIIGAGAVVANDVPPGKTYFGNPARELISPKKTE